MYTSEEKGIIERCFAISIWNHRASKSAIAGKALEAHAFRERVKVELGVLKRLLRDGDNGASVECRPGNRVIEFFGGLMRRVEGSR